MPDKGKLITFRSPYPTTDIIIRYKQVDEEGKGKEGIVLIERKNPPYGLAIPGGFLEYGLSLEENARKEAREETGLEIILRDGTHPYCVRSDPSRDPRFHAISIVYLVEGYGRLKAGDDALEARVYSMLEVESLVRDNKLAFDHGDILKEYLQDWKRSIPVIRTPGGWL